MKELRSANRLNSGRSAERMSPISSAIIPIDKMLYENSPDENKVIRRPQYPLSSVNSAVSDLIMKKALSSSLSSSLNSLASNRKEDLEEEPMDVENTKPERNSQSSKSSEKPSPSKKNPVYCEAF